MENLNNAITLANYVTVVVYSLAAAYGMWRFRKLLDPKSDVAYLVRGTKIIILAVCGHQLYWGISRFATMLGNKEFREFMYNNSWLTTAFYFCAFYGMIRVFSVATHKNGRVHMDDVMLVACLWLFVVLVVMLQ